MPSPYPGMDPYLEGHWGDVHQSLVVYASDALRPQLPPVLRARIAPYVVAEDESRPHYSAFVRIIERPDFRPESTSTAVLERHATEPLVMELIPEPLTLRSIRILDVRSGHRIVTGIEFVSPGNKTGRAPRKQYREKRRDLLRGGANVVEIDLTREGPYILSVPAGRVPPDYRTPYRVCVTRANRPDRPEIYRLPLQEKLPTIRIPLRTDDSDVFLDLQQLVSTAWNRGGYDDIDYRAEPEPPLRGVDAAWSDALLRERGLR